MSDTPSKKKDYHCHYSGPCANCQRIRPLYARRMCKSCYEQYRIAHNIGVCAVCGMVKGLMSKDKCITCYRRTYKKPVHEGRCWGCERYMRLQAVHMCSTCYRKSRSVHAICPQCGEKRLLVKSAAVCERCQKANIRNQRKEQTV